MLGNRPIVTLTSDFGLSDHYVAAMKAAILGVCPDAHCVDVTHLIPRHDILCGAIAVERALDAFAAETVHLAVIDPGVGTARRILAAQIKGQVVVCPDNGLITWAWRRWGPRAAAELTWRPKQYSATFHGRDIMAPAAGKIAAGIPLATLCAGISDPVLLAAAPATELSEARIIHIDHFGNATTNVPGDLLPAACAVIVKGRRLGPVRSTYCDVGVGAALALIGSSDLLEIAVREGAAAEALGLKIGDEVTFQ